MAKINAPLFSLNASGSIDNKLTYRDKSNIKTASKYSKPGDRKSFESSPKQKDQRSIIGLVTAHWQLLSPASKSTWNDMAKLLRKPITGYSYFIRLAQTDLGYYLGLIGFWTMNYNIIDKIPDLSGRNNYGTLAPTYPSDSPQLVDSIDNKQGKALSFDGINNRVNFGNDLIFNFTTGDFSMELLIKPTMDQEWCYLLKRETWEVGGYSLRVDLTYKIMFIMNFLGGTYIVFSLPNAINNNYNFISIVRTGPSLRLFSNGVDVTFGSGTITEPSSIINNLYLSSSVNGFLNFDGIVDNLTIWNRALSQKEIQRHCKIFMSNTN